MSTSVVHATFPVTPASQPGILSKLTDPTSDAFALTLFGNVLAVEQAAAHLPGATKAEIAVTTTLAGLQAAGQVIPPGKAQTGVALASMFVGLLNSFGLFKKKP